MNPETVGRRTPTLTRTLQETIDDLREFIAALDRRVPALERTGEIDIARDAAALRDKALKRLAGLEPQR